MSKLRSVLSLSCLFVGNLFAFDPFTPALNLTGPFIVHENGLTISSLVMNHVDSYRTHGYLTAPFDCWDRPSTLFLEGFDQKAKIHNQENTPHFDFDTYGGFGGIDFHLPKNVLMSFAGGYMRSHTEHENNLGSAGIDSYFGMVYGNSYCCDVYFSPAIIVLYNQIDNQRLVPFFGAANSCIKGWQYIPHMEIGYKPNSCICDLTPFTAFDWSYFKMKRYSENGGDLYAVHVKSHGCSTIRSETGFKLNQSFTLWDTSFTLREKVSYVFLSTLDSLKIRYAFMGDADWQTAKAFEQNMNLGSVEVNLDWRTKNRCPFSISVGYRGEFGSRIMSNLISVTLAQDF